MGRTNAQLLAFNRGEVSKQALARVDVAKLQLAAECQLNWTASITGAMSLRPGLQQIGSTQSNQAAKLIPFVFSKTDTAQFELTPNLLRIRIPSDVTPDALITRVVVSTSVSDPNFAGGGSWSTSGTTAGCTSLVAGGAAVLTALAQGGLAQIKQTLSVATGDRNKVHGLRVVVSRGPVTLRAGTADGLQDVIPKATLGTGTHSLAFTPTTGSVYLQIESSDRREKILTSVSIEAAGVLTLPTPWGAGDLAKLRWEQSGDIVFVDCDGVEPYMITRRSASGFGVEVDRPDNGPFQDAPSLEMTLTPSVCEGNGTLTASRPFFKPSMTGALVRLFTHGQTNARRLGAEEAYSEPVRISGVDNDRVFGWSVTGVWSGVLSLQRSIVGPTSGFTDVFETSTNGTFSNDDSATLNNVVAWYRVGFKRGYYISGAADVEFGQTALPDPPIEKDISAEDDFSDDLTVSGLLAARTLTLTVQGSFEGTLTLLRVDPAADVATVIGDTLNNRVAISYQDGLGGGVATYRVGFKTGDYVSGTASVTLRKSSVGISGGSPSAGSGALAGGRYGVCRITGYYSPTLAAVEIIEPFSSLNPTTDWVEGAWSPNAGFPSAICLHDGRMWHFGGERWWGSQPGNYWGYAAFDKLGASFDDAGVVTGAYGSGPHGVTNWAISALRLLIGREQSIESGRSSSLDEPITPDAFGVKPCSTDGADRLPALKVDQRAVYVQQSHGRVFELGFSAQSGDYVPRDLTRLNTEIGSHGFVATAAQRQPDPVLHFPRGDGQSAGMLYQPAEEVEAWLRIQTLGVIEDVCVMPSDLSEDRVYFVVRRTINGQTVRFIEKMALRSDCAGGQINCLFDSYVRYSGAPATSFTATHLPNTPISLWADGKYIGTATTDGAGVVSPLPDGEAHSNIVGGLVGEVVQATASSLTGTLAVPAAYNGYPAEVFADIGGTGKIIRVGTVTIAGGAVTLPEGKTARTIMAFVGYVAPFVSSKFGGTVPLGTKRRATALGLLLYDTHASGIKIGQQLDVLEDLPEIENEQTVDPDLVWPEYAEDAIEVPGEWSTDARLVLLAAAPFPATVGGAVVSIEG